MSGQREVWVVECRDYRDEEWQPESFRMTEWDAREEFDSMPYRFCRAVRYVPAPAPRKRRAKK